ncbi:MAG: hypothetical protein LBI80_04845 [Endomicrobium sp.]|nr:hypothetical protein [Endomicrobium sp.]
MSVKLKIRKLAWVLKNSIKVFYKKFDVIFILDSAKASIMLAKLARIPKIVGGDLFFLGYDIKDPVTRYYTDKIVLPKDQNNMHVAIRYQTIIKSFFNIYNNSLPVLPDSKKYYQEVKKLIKNKSKLNVVVCVKGSKNSPHIWNIENFKKVILLIDEYFNHGISFYLVGSKENFDYSQNAVVSSNVYNICGKTSLLGLREFLKLTDLLISVDTGVVHVAATTEINIISIASSADSINRVRTISSKAVSIHKKYHCGPCILKRNIKNFKCKGYLYPECLKQIKPEEVTKEAIKVLDPIYKNLPYIL